MVKHLAGLRLSPKDHLDELGLGFVHGKSLSPSHCEQAYQLDQIFYPKEDLIELETGLQWMRRNPEILSGLVDARSEKLMGYINLMPVSRKTLAKLKDPSFHDVGLRAEQIEVYSQPGPHTGYFASLCMAPNFHGKKDKYGQFLSDQLFWAKLTNLAASDITFEEIWARAINRKGARLLGRLGFQFVSNEHYVLRSNQVQTS